MTTQHFEFLVEEPSMEAFLRGLLPRMLPEDCSFQIHPFQGKQDLLNNLEKRLRGYLAWLPNNWRIVVVVDQDDDDCRQLKKSMEQIATRVGLRTTSTFSSNWQVANRIAVEELEAWYFGDWAAVCSAYPRVPATVPRQRAYRNPDAISGGTWQAFERLMQKHRYFKGGLPKIEVARVLGQSIDPDRCQSPSFRCFRNALIRAACTCQKC